jgi:LDH2 family malate/lactate/ureidoglycolate dehydrogenase
MPEPDIVCAAPALQRITAALLAAAGTPDDLAMVVAESLVAANLAGHDSHGVMRLPGYVGAVRGGHVKPAERAAVTGRRQAVAMVDGKWGWGQTAGRLATETAMALAREFGVGAVTIQHCNHIGRVGEYTEIMARVGMMGIVLCNAGVIVAPYGGRERLLGTNPFSWAAPTADPERPLALDFATSVFAGGKVDVARAKGLPMKPGVLIDAAGHPTTAPEDFYHGGALLPAGAYKGYGLGVMVELLGGSLSGGAPSCLPEHEPGNGPLFLAFNIPSFRPLDQFVDHATRLGTALRASQPAPGFERVQVPGDPEVEMRHLRREAGIPLPARTWQALQELATQLGLVIEEATREIRAL